MRIWIPFGMVVALVCVLAAVPVSKVFAEEGEPDLLINIQVSPATILIGADQAVMVTVHAEIPYSTVEGASVTLNGITVRATFSDLRGDLVAKFLSSEVKGVVSPGNGELTLTGMTKDGQVFSGTTIVRVVKYAAPAK
ncbi:MAG: hypothetical protein IT364_18065 [Candidatus Hydrogenedentes bacterium]|nr:hypothetical protein [Candidatus Hydrogenedentota bacterium]